MTHRTFPRRPRARVAAPGFTLIELMVAITIGLFIALGFSVAFVNLKTTFNTQSQLGALQDNERLALSLLSASAQQAGYFPDPLNNTAAALMPAYTDSTYGGMSAGQDVVGKAAGSSTPEYFTTRYTTSGSDGLLNCLGNTSSTANQVFRNTFYVDSSTNELMCRYYDGSTAATVALVSGVQGMSVRYGVDTNSDGVVDRYAAPADVTTAQWQTVRSLRVTLTFQSPYSGAGAGSSTPVWVQTINLMNNK